MVEIAVGLHRHGRRHTDVTSLCTSTIDDSASGETWETNDVDASTVPRGLVLPRYLAVVLGASMGLSACTTDSGKPTTAIPVVDAGGTSGEADAAPEGGTGGPKGPGANCTADGECQSGKCFIGGKASWCSYPCNASNVATVCVPVPPFDGTCNNQGFCRRPN
jgi:hypothetical protein